MLYVTGALATGVSVKDVFDRWSPEAYAGITDQMKFATLDNLPELGGYEKLVPGRTYATGSFNRNGIKGAMVVGYTQSNFRDDAFNAGIAHQFGFGQVSVSYGHSDGNFYGTNLSARTLGNQGSAGISVPVALDQALRIMGRVTYGGYTSKGTRGTNSGAASFAGVHSDVVAYGGGVEYLKQHGAVNVDTSAELIGMHETVDGFSEGGDSKTGSAAELDRMTVGRIRRNALIGRLAATVGYAVTPKVQLYAKGTLDHEFGNRMTDINARLSTEQTGFTVENTGLARDRFSGGGGVRVDLTQRLQINAEAGAGTSASYRFGGGLRLRF